MLDLGSDWGVICKREMEWDTGLWYGYIGVVMENYLLQQFQRTPLEKVTVSETELSVVAGPRDPPRHACSSLATLDQHIRSSALQL